MDLEPTYHLEGIIRTKEEMADFEGPLTLILMLLSKNKLEIRDIPVAEISEQYLAYLEEMKALDLEIASEFVQMAAHLLFIKTKMLLSSAEETPDELEMLIASLEELKAREIYTALREVCPALSRASELGMRYCTKPPEPLRGGKEYRYRHESWELLSALSAVFRRGKSAPEEEDGGAGRLFRLPKRIVYPVREKSREILLRLVSGGEFSLRAFYAQSRSRSETVAVFLSILELCSLGHTRMVRRESDVIVEFTGGDPEAILANIPE